MLILSKVIYFFITPLTWLILTIFFWAFAKKKKVKQFAKVSSIVIVLFFSNTFIYKEALHLWEIPAVNKSEVEYHDVGIDRKSTRLNSSHVRISYAVFCLKKKKRTTNNDT